MSKAKSTTQSRTITNEPEIAAIQHHQQIKQTVTAVSGIRYRTMAGTPHGCSALHPAGLPPQPMPHTLHGINPCHLGSMEKATEAWHHHNGHKQRQTLRTAARLVLSPCTAG